MNVPDERFDWLVDKYKPKSIVNPYLEVVDIAGLVKGAAQGAGLGNHFLSNIRAVDGIIHAMRAFEDPDIVHVEDKVDPVRDIEIITAELREKDKEFVGKRLAELMKDKAKANSNAAAKKEWEAEVACCEKIIAYLEDGKEVRRGVGEGDADYWTTKEIVYLNEYSLLTAKPVMYLINLSEADFRRKKNKFLKPIHDWVMAHGGGPMIPYSAAFESEYMHMDDEAKAEYCKEGNVTCALPKIIKTAFNAIHLIYFFTAGPDEVKGWVIRKGYKAPQAAGTIHTDFERGFICAEVMSFDDLKQHGTEAEVKAVGRYRQEGKMYVVQDGDVIFFKFNVTNKK